MIVRREFIKKLIFGGVSLPLLAHIWPHRRPAKTGIVKKEITNISSGNESFKIFFEDELYNFNDRSFIASFAQDYLNDRPHYRRRGALLKEVSQRLGHTPPFKPGQIANFIRDDFEADRIVTYKGWVFADMEAQLCALTALSHDLETGLG